MWLAGWELGNPDGHGAAVLLLRVFRTLRIDALQEHSPGTWHVTTLLPDLSKTGVSETALHQFV